MKICVFGLWHLGIVTAACLAKKGFTVVGVDLDSRIVSSMRQGKLPIYEPGLDELVACGCKEGRLTFTDDPCVLQDAQAVWVTFDTPVSEDDCADIEFVEKNIVSIMSYIKDGAAVIISSQVPVGFTRRVEEKYAANYPNRKVAFAYSPENLRLGKAISVFDNPGRIIIGIRNLQGKDKFLPIFSGLCNRLEWMRIESAEMTKHAINSFLATSVVFANEIAVLCEKVGADAKEVERGLRSEERIGPKAYITPGAAFAGGTLARDINFLMNLSKQTDQKTFLFEAIRDSNIYHKDWVKRKCKEFFPSLKNKIIAVLGLTYKPGTNTLRRSLAVELCRWFVAEGARVKIFDPEIKDLPDSLKGIMLLCKTIEEVLKGVDCVVIATTHSILKENSSLIVNLAQQKVIIDANGFLEDSFREIKNVCYIAVGRKTREAHEAK